MTRFVMLAACSCAQTWRLAACQTRLTRTLMKGENKRRVNSKHGCGLANDSYVSKNSKES